MLSKKPKLRSLIAALVLWAGSLPAQQAYLAPPTQLSVCGSEPLSFTITGGGSGLQDANITIGLPCGLQYQIGSVSGGSEVGGGDLAQPSFALPDVAAGDTLSLSVGVEVTCEALPCINEGELFFVTMELEQAGGSQAFTSDLFNVEAPNPLIINVGNLYWEGALNESVNRTLTIRNTRPGRLASFEFLDAHVSSVAVSSNDGETLAETADTLLLRFGPQDFAQIGNGDGWFDFGEELVITEQVRVVDCAYETRSADSELVVRWGCGGSFCQSQRVNAKVKIVDIVEGGDVLELIELVEEPECFDGGTAEQTLRIRRNNQSSGLIDFQLTLRQPGDGRGIRIGSLNSSFLDSIIYHDPVLTACGDSVANSATLYFVNPLPPPISGPGLFEIEWATAFCEPGRCSPPASHWDYAYRYYKACAAPDDRFVSREGSAGSNEALISDALLLNGSLENNSPIDIVYELQDIELDEVAGELRLKLMFPAFFVLQPTDFALEGVLPLSQTVTTDTINFIELVYPLPLGAGAPYSLAVPTILDCSGAPDLRCLPSIYSDCIEPCPTGVGVPYGILAEAVVFKDESCTEAGQLRACSNILVPLPCYEGVCYDTLAGYLDYTFEVARTTLGWPYKDGDLQPDEDGIYDFDLMRLDRMAPGDTFELRIDGVVRTDEPGMELEYFTLEVGHDGFEVVSLGNGSNLPVGPTINHMIGDQKKIKELTNTLLIYDASAEVWYEVANAERTFLPSRQVFLYNLSVPALRDLNPGIPEDFRYAEGDSVKMLVKKRVDGNLNIRGAGLITSSGSSPFSMIRFAFRYNTRTYFDRIPIDAFRMLPTCNCQSQVVEIANVTFRHSPSGDGARNGNCEAARPISGKSVLRSSLAFPFPGEIKPFFRAAQFRLDKVEGMVFDSIALRRYNAPSLLLIQPYDSAGHVFFDVPASLPFVGVTVNEHFELILHRHFTSCISEWPDQNGQLPVEVILERTPIGAQFFPASYVGVIGAVGPQYDAVDICDLQLEQTAVTSFAADFTVDVALTVRAGNNTNLPYDNLYLRPVYPAAAFEFVQVVNVETGEVYPAVNGIFQLGSVMTPDTLRLQLRGRSSSCGTETIRLDYGFDCSPFTDPAQSPCALESETLSIDFPPGLIDLQAEADDLSANLCDTMPRTQALLFNAGLGAVYNMQVEITLPPGLHLIPGSCTIEYPAGSGQLLPIADPMLLQGRSFAWDLAAIWPLMAAEGLAGVNSSPRNEYYLRFDTETDCDFISGTRIIYRMVAEQACEAPTNAVAKVTGRYQIEGVEPPYASNLNVNFSGSLNCGDTLALNATFQYPANTDANLYVTLPSGIHYISGSTNGNGSYAEPVLQDGQLRWTVNSPFSDVMLSFQIVADEGTDCSVPVLSHFTTTKVPAICVSEGQSCEIEVVTGDANLPLSVDKAAYEVLDFSATAQAGTMDLSLQATIANTANPNSLPIQVGLYLDMDGDGQLSPADSLLQLLVLDGISEEGGSTVLQALLADLPREQWCQLLLVLEAEANCACQTLAVPLSNRLVQETAAIGLCWDEQTELGVDPLPGYAYQWSGATGLSCTQCPEAVFSSPNTGASSEVYELELQESSGLCIISHAFELTVNPQPFILSDSETICQGDTASLIASLGTTFEWSGPDLLINDEQVVLAAPQSTAVYTLAITDNLGCSSTDSVTVEVVAPPEMQGDAVQRFCFGPPAQLQLTAKPGTAYEWINAGDRLSDIYSPSPWVEVEEDYTYQLLAQNGVCARIFEVSVDFFQAFEIEGVTDTVQACLGDTLALSLSGGVQYEWTSVQEVICENPPCGEVRIPVSFVESTFSVLATDTAQCEANRVFKVQRVTDTILPLQLESICSGDSLHVFGQWVSAEGLYCDTMPTVGSCIRVECVDLAVLPSWATSDSATICEGESYDFYGTLLTEPGLYTEPFTAANGCDSLVAIDLSVLPEAATALQSAICQNDTFLFDGQALTVPGTYTAEYQTAEGCDSLVTLMLSLLPEYEETLQATICEGEAYAFNEEELTTAGTYSVSLQSAAGCDSLVTLVLAVQTSAESFFDTVLCLGEVLDLGGEAFSAAGDYTLAFTDENGCDSLVYLMLDYYPPPLYELEVVPDYGYGDGTLSITLTDSTLTLAWADGSTGLQRSDLPAGFYYAAIADEWGCVTEIELEVPAGEIQLAMPNTFTPNGDGLNDFFNVLSNTGTPEVLAFRIFNRWGQQVYNNQRPQQGWDGTFKGRHQPSEVYHYQIEVQTPSGPWYRQGDVTLVR
jgi:gliding motility-associated-like protein